MKPAHVRACRQSVLAMGPPHLWGSHRLAIEGSPTPLLPHTAPNEDSCGLRGWFPGVSEGSGKVSFG